MNHIHPLLAAAARRHGASRPEGALWADRLAEEIQRLADDPHCTSPNMLLESAVLAAKPSNAATPDFLCEAARALEQAAAVAWHARRDPHRSMPPAREPQRPGAGSGAHGNRDRHVGRDGRDRSGGTRRENGRRGGGPR